MAWRSSYQNCNAFFFFLFSVYCLQIPCPSWFDSWTVCICCSEKDQAWCWEGYICLCQEHLTSLWWAAIPFRWAMLYSLQIASFNSSSPSYYSCFNVCSLRRKQGRRRISLHDLQRREHLWILLTATRLLCKCNLKFVHSRIVLQINVLSSQIRIQLYWDQEVQYH